MRATIAIGLAVLLAAGAAWLWAAPPPAAAVPQLQLASAPVTGFAKADGRLVFTIGSGADAAKMVTSLIEGTFPPFDDVIPKEHDRRVTCDVAMLTAAVRRSSLLTSEQSKGVRMSFTATQLTLSSSSPDVGDSEITMPLEGFQGEPIEVGFNPGYIVDALKIIDAPEVTIELKATNKPGVLRIGQEFTYVIMPLNV